MQDHTPSTVGDDLNGHYFHLKFFSANGLKSKAIDMHTFYIKRIFFQEFSHERLLSSGKDIP